MFNTEHVRWIKTYPIDSLQIYFAASLEIQEELINMGFYVPRSIDKKIVMPVPLIYSDYRGWLKPAGPITIERLIPPEWLDLEPDKLGWKKTLKNGKEAYILPEEEVYVDIGISGSSVFFDLIINGYHLERTSIRGVNPERWNNWAMFYLSLDYVDEIINMLEENLPRSVRPPYSPSAPGCIAEPRKEIQQGGKETTYYVEVPVKDFSFCLGCPDLGRRYLYVKAREHCSIDPSLSMCRNPREVLNSLKLRLRYSPSINTFAKVGIAKITGKRPQIMVKLASTGPKKAIRGILKPIIEGKSRGELIFCDHRVNRQYIALDLVCFYRALTLSTSSQASPFKAGVKAY